MSFWLRLGPSFTSGTLARLVDFGSEASYDSGGNGADNTNGAGATIYSPFSSEIQNGVDASPNTALTMPASPVLSVLSAFPSGLINDGATWYFEAVTYDGTLSQNNFLTWLGSSNQSMQILGSGDLLDANFGPIPFTTNATVKIGNDLSPGAPRGLTYGAIAD